MSRYNFILVLFLIGFFVSLHSCESENAKEEVELEQNDPDSEDTDSDSDSDNDNVNSFLLPDIDLSNWKVTLPIANSDDKPIEVEPTEILDYATNETLIPFMYNDSIDGSLVFYTYPGATTPNSSRSRTELREQMEPGSNNINWTFPQGGRMKGTLRLQDISKDVQGNYHRTIIMQIHGRLTNEQRDAIGEDDNNAPPILKIYWDKGKVRVKSKQLKDPNTSGNDILYTSSWEDDEGFNFAKEVGFEKFSLEIIAQEGKMEVILNDEELVVFNNADIEKWSVFENYFKAGNYLQTNDEGASATVKYYELSVEH